MGSSRAASARLAAALLASLALGAAGPADAQPAGTALPDSTAPGTVDPATRAPADPAASTPAPSSTDASGSSIPADDASAPPAAAKPPAKPARGGFLSRLPLVGRFFGEPAADAEDGKVAPHYALDVEAPESVARSIREFTLLGRWRQRADYDPSQLPLFMRRADEEVRELMAAEGWFDAKVTITRTADGVRIAVDPGRRTVVADVVLRLSGEVGAPEHEALRERVRRAWPLAEGQPFRSAEWDRAKREVLATLRDAGYLRARVDDSEAVVVRDEARASLRVEVESGTRLQFGGLSINGLQRYPAGVVEGLAPFRPGDPYDARRMLEFQTRLNGGGWFTTVNVRPDTAALDADESLAQVPIRVDVAERQAKRLALGAGYDTDRGVSLLAGWEYRNVFGLGVQTFNGVELDLERQVGFSTWDTPQDVDGRRWQFGARLEHRDVQNDLVDAGSVFASRNRRSGDNETAVSLQYQTERQSIVFGPADERVFDNRALVLGYTWTRRRLDSPIFPSKGYIVSAQVSGASESLGSERTFTRAYGFGYGIVPLAMQGEEEFGRIVLRGEAGMVFAESREGIPTVNLFRTGGTKSVRGYASQSLGVPFGEAIVGGRVLLTGSIEYQHLIDRDFAVAAFYDRGAAADTRASLKTVAGYGIGARWRTPVGPLNLDVARGQQTGEWRFHFSIGVVF